MKRFATRLRATTGPCCSRSKRGGVRLNSLRACRQARGMRVLLWLTRCRPMVSGQWRLR